MLYIAVALLILIVGKTIWVRCATRNIGSFESEKTQILRRRNYLLDKVITEPSKLIKMFPAGIGEQFQGEWALYTCSMLSASLVNIATLYPETKEESLTAIDSLIEMVLSAELRKYDRDRWEEDPLETLDGDLSHISYLSHLAWMIAGYKQLGGGCKYDEIYLPVCEAMNRRLLASPHLNLETYPGEHIYVPDVLVAIVALKLYSKHNNGKYASTVSKWLDNMKENHIRNSENLIASIIVEDDEGGLHNFVKGSYTALSCYYLTFIDETFAQEQYNIFKSRFYKKFPMAGFKEYAHKSPIVAFDIDAGPILFGLSPTGTAFGIGPASFFNDTKVRKKLLRTAERAGSTVTIKSKSHYLLANIAIVGEAITLAMRTATPWQLQSFK